MPADAQTVRIEYGLSEGSTLGTFRYALPSVDEVRGDEKRRTLIENLAEAVNCVRIVGEMPSPSDRDGTQQLRSTLWQARVYDPALVQRSGVTVCVPDRMARFDPTAWTVVRAIEFRTDGGAAVTAPVSPSDTAEPAQLQEVWNAELPELARGVYVRLIFVDGAESEETRVPVAEVDVTPR